MWFRRDLRIADNPALGAAVAAAQAAGDGRVVPLFVVDPALWASAGPVRRRYLVDSLRKLDAALDGQLLIQHGHPTDVLTKVAAAAGATSIHYAADYAPYGMRRDAVVTAAVPCSFVATGSPYAVAPGRVVKGDGTPFKVYTPFFKAWCAHGWRDPADPIGDATWWMPVECDGFPDAPSVPGMTLPTAGEDAAWARWEDFRARALSTYGDDRNRADLDGTSVLSHALRWGEIHPRSLLAELDDSPGSVVYRKEIAWREFYADVLFHNPTSISDSLDARFDSILPWEGSDSEAFDAWRSGKTGFPFVDAGMRQLLATGWMHNRLRMVVASFLVKDLHIAWQHGAAYFMSMLRDGDIASNQHGWQWTAGCGTDASPYYRVFNPVLQGVKFDPDGEYVRRWIPELAHIPGKAVHEPWNVIDGYANGYPEPIVDHASERDEALRRFALMKGKSA